MLGRAAVIAIILTTAAASAAPKSPLVYNWSGWYVGGNGGYAWGEDSVVDPNATFGSDAGLFLPGFVPLFVGTQLATFGAVNTKPQGGFGGLQTGYNYQFGAFVIGLEADYDWANIEASSQRTAHSDFAPGL